MDNYLKLKPEEQRVYCEQAQTALGFPATTLEKDFWVCWTLRELFRVPIWGPHLTFKGGTSLSKAWKLIQRFSEDIDVVVDRTFLGFGPQNSPEEGESNTAIRKKLDILKSTCSERIRLELVPTLHAHLNDALPEGSTWSIEMASPEEAPEQHTVLFTYPTAFPTSADYLRRVVKIELIAKSDHEPSRSATIQPYLAEVFPEAFPDASFKVVTLAAERTFLEKAMLVHEETFRPLDKPRKPGMTRHYYDLWAMINHGIGTDAIQIPGLFQQIGEHRKVYFKWNWVDYTTLKPGTMRLVPPGEHLNFWKQDYENMRREMFSGEVPSFDEMMEVIARFEQKWNEGQSA